MLEPRNELPRIRDAVERLRPCIRDAPNRVLALPGAVLRQRGFDVRSGSC